MPRFDWERFLRSRGVVYSPSANRQVVVHCPFCGEDDQSQHMSINLDGRGWRCWRQPASHFGRSPVRLVQKLVGCTTEEAHRITGTDAPAPVPAASTLRDNLAKLRGDVAAPVRPRELHLPREFHPLTDFDDPRAGHFVDYMVERRGYRESEVRWLAATYGLQWAVRGPFAWRVIFPIRDHRGALLTWTARAISDAAQLRYKQPRVEQTVVEAPKTLLGLERLFEVRDPRVLVLCEGPLDATRITVSGAPFGVWATCMFGLSFSAEQRELVMELAEMFPRVALLLDGTADKDRLRIVRQLRPLPVLLPRLPAGADDPGELTPAQATKLCLQLLDQ